MPRLYVYYCNHLDLTWRRPRYRYGSYDGSAVVPYALVQEKQVDAGLDFIRQGGKYDIEQAITLREYLDRNPDAYPEIRQMILDGKLHVLGNGEAGIDTNLPSGETLIRNHVYANRWLKQQFHMTPKFADLPDAFGLSGGMPTLYSELGYKGLARFGRVFLEAKPYWQGVSGAVIPLKTARLCMPTIPIFSDISCRVCDLCNGAGCAACNHEGYYPVQNMVDSDVSWLVERILGIRAEDPRTDICIDIEGEESVTSPNAMELLKQIAEAAELELCPVGLEDLIAMDHAELLAEYEAGTYRQEDIDPRQEGNPVATGCYTGRIKLKQLLRKCESALLAAEHLCVAAEKEQGACYPKKAMEELWRQLQFLFFHDAATASHSDDAYAELMDIAHGLCAKANRMTNHAIEAILKGKKEADPTGTYFVVFNPLEFDVKNARLQGSVRASEFVTGGDIIHPDGHISSAVDFRHTAIPEFANAIVEFYGDLPAFGYRVFQFLPKQSQTVCKENVQSVVLENEHLCVTISNYGVASVLDKHLNQLLAVNGSFTPVITDDTGHTWGKYIPSYYRDNGACPSYRANLVPPKVLHRSMEQCHLDTVQRARVHIQYSRPDQRLELLDWTATFELPAASRELLVKIQASLDAKDLRLSTQIVLPQIPKDHKLEYDIPLGKIKRDTQIARNELGYADEWPALHYICAQLPDANVLLCNNGTPAHKLTENVIDVALLRTPTQCFFSFNVDGAIDPSVHEFAFSLSASPDRDLSAYQKGMAFNTTFPTACGRLTSSEGNYLHLDIPTNAPLLALKKAEDVPGYLVRYLGMEKPVLLTFPKPVTPVSLLEETKAAPVAQDDLPPYAIRSYLLAP